MRYNFPYATPGQRIGLLGGSFDPAHEGHVHITKEALKRFKLDRVWWLISPKNPLKERNPDLVGDRIKEANLLLSHPRVVVTDLEIQLSTQYTSDTILKLKRLYPRVSFVWLMGADNIPTFNLWKNWKKIMREVPIGVVDRPGNNYATRKNKMTESFKNKKMDVILVGVKDHIFKQFEDLKVIPQTLPEEKAYNSVRSGLKYLKFQLENPDA